MLLLAAALAIDIVYYEGGGASIDMVIVCSPGGAAVNSQGFHPWL